MTIEFLSNPIFHPLWLILVVDVIILGFQILLVSAKYELSVLRPEVQQEQEQSSGESGPENV